MPDSSVPLFLVLTLAATWALQVPQTLSWWTLLAALLLLAIHLACTLGGYGPPALALDRGTLTAWVVRGLLMASATAVVWLGTLLLAGLDLPAGPVPVIAGLAVVLGWTAYLGRRLLTR
jgi:hypothetical protein